MRPVKSKPRALNEKRRPLDGPVISVLVLMLIITGFFSSSSKGESSVEWQISIPGESPSFNGSTPILIAGIEHNLTFYIGNSRHVVVTMKARSMGDEENYTNSYEWAYDNGNFSDLRYGTYINITSSKVFGENIAFHIGLHAKAWKGLWSITVKRSLGADYETIIDENIDVEKADPRLAISTPVFEFRVEPFESGEMISPVVSDYHFLTRNTGNVPLWLECDYDHMGEIFHTTNMSIVLHPHDEVEHQIFLTSMPWSPQVFRVKEYVRGTAMHMITSDMVSFIPSFQTVVKINVEVVRQGFNIMDIGPAKLQYQRGPMVEDFNDIIDLHLFLSGDSDATLTISSSRIELMGVYTGGEWHNTSDISQSLNFHLTNDSEEKEILVRVRCYREDTTAKVTYELSAGNRSDSVYTEILVGKAPFVPEPADDSRHVNTVALAGALFVLAVIGIIMYLYTRRVREMDENEDDEKREREMKRKRRKNV